MGSPKQSTKKVTPKSSSSHNTKNHNPIKETCPSFRRGHLPSTEDLKRLRSLALPHVGSFDYFLDHGLAAGISDIVPIEIDLVDPRKNQPQQQQQTTTNTTSSNVVTSDVKEVDTLKMWLENIKISKPVKSDQYASSFISRGSNKSINSSRLIPRDCRELGLMYSGPITGEVCYQINHRKIGENGEMTEIVGKICRMSKRFGDMPIMVMSKACHLYGSKPDQLVKMKEEVSVGVVTVIVVVQLWF